jgi:uncharacterized protein (TIGR03086 family)
MSFGSPDGLNCMERDLHPAAQRMTAVVTGLRDDQLDLPTPCPSYTVSDLLAHVHGLSLAFAAAANKERNELVEHAPGDDALPPLPDDWRTVIPAELATLAAAWADETAWSGMTRIAGGDTPGEVCGLVCIDELVVHAWDLARATGQSYDCDQASLEGSLQFLGHFQVPGQEAPPGSPFGTVIEVPDAAPLLDRVVGMTGRDPAWTP